MSRMLKMLKSQHPDKEYPSNIGQKWTDEEENQLIEELNHMNTEEIAKLHHRTTGGILSRRNEIAYKLYCNHTPIEEIITKTKLDEFSLLEIIKRKNSEKPEKPEKKSEFNLDHEISEIKKDMKEIKMQLQKMVGMMTSIYEFETA
jgi:hypothetical protein